MSSPPGHCCPSPAWSPSKTRKSTLFSTGSHSPGRSPTSPRFATVTIKSQLSFNVSIERARKAGYRPDVGRKIRPSSDAS
jgi:hypothetical protein